MPCSDKELYKLRWKKCPQPKRQAHAAVKRVVRYLKGTSTHGITYGTDNGLVGYTEADWASDGEIRRFL